MNKKPLVLLHGALGSKAQLDELVPGLEQNFEVHQLDFEGHGGAGPTDSPFRLEYFVENVLGFLDEHDIPQTNIFGYSMGGYVALMLAKDYPERIKKVATLGTILQWSVETAQRECKYLHPEKIKDKVPHFAEALDEQHPAGWQRVVERTREMLHHLGNHPPLTERDWKEVKTPVRFHIGDRDTTAGLETTAQIYKKTDNTELCVLPNTSHPIEAVKTEMLIASLTAFYLH